MAISGRIVSLWIAPRAAAPMQAVPAAQAMVGRGLAGDRYFDGRGTYSTFPGNGRQVTLIEEEAIAALARDYGITIDSGLARRNIVTTGIALNHLVGRDFSAGAVRLRGMRLCEPCAHLEKLSAKGAMAGLIHRGGLRAEIVSGGELRAGDAISVIG